MARSGRLTVAIATLLAIALLGLTGCDLPWQGKDDSQGEQFLAEGEVFLAAASDVGPDPFSTDPLSTPVDKTLAQPVSSPSATVEAPSGTQIVAQSGNKPGLYGGSQKLKVCDPNLLVDFLSKHPDKAAAWVAALNADPEVHLPNGNELTTATIPEYVASLTSVVLTQDTRVTNHLFKNGKPVPFQAVLQKGTAVLVDNKGVPRARCFCGNPLLKPVATKVKPKYTGGKWPDFDPAKIQVVQTSPKVITVYVLVDPATGQQFQLPAGSTITATMPASSTSTSPSAGQPSASVSPTESSDPSVTFTVTDSWKVTTNIGKASKRRSYTFSPAPGKVDKLNSARTDYLVPGVSISDFTGLYTARGLVDRFMKANRQYTNCNVHREPVSVSGWTGEVGIYGPCRATPQVGPSRYQYREYGLTRPDGTVLFAIVRIPAGDGSALAHLASILSTFQKA